MVHADLATQAHESTPPRRGAPLADAWRVLRPAPTVVGEPASDEVLIGPPGVFVVATHAHPGATVCVTRRTVLVDGHPVPYLSQAATAARWVSHLVGGRLGRLVPVTPVVCLAGARLQVRVTPGHVLVTTRRRLSGLLGGRPHVLGADDVEQVYAAGRLALGTT